MRIVLLISGLLIAGFFLVRNKPGAPVEPSGTEPTMGAQPRAAAPAVIVKLSAARPVEDLKEQIYKDYGMPALDSAWDAAALKQVAAALRNLRQNRPLALPGPDTNYGKAFFNKLLYTTKRFHLLSPENKVTTYNAFTGIFPEFAVAPIDGRPRDRELALLTGMEFELIAGFTEDPSFVKDIRTQKYRSMQDLSGNTIIAKASNIHFIGQAATIAQNVEQRLKMIGDKNLFGPEARVLALSRISLHLPTIINRLSLTTIRATLEANLRTETDAQVREYYNALLLRVP
jgi:hypothetical protein